MPYCPKCGKEVADDTRFCANCGASLGESAQPAAGRTNIVLPVRPTGRQDLLGLVSAGVVLILIGITYSRYTVDLTMIRDYIQSMANSGVFIKPPQVLFDPMIFFLYAAGAWGILLTILRLAVERNVGKAVQDLFGCFFAFFLAFLLTNYAARVFTERMLTGYFIVAIGLLVVANTAVSVLSSRRKQNRI